MDGKAKILLIENQYTQFRPIAIFLHKRDFDVQPRRVEYIPLMNNIRIFLNERYGPLGERNKRSLAFSEIVKFIEGFTPDIFIIDQVLVGNHQGLDGIFLMEQLRPKFPQPILFLSRTAANDVRVMENLPRLSQPTEWINKGYFGEEILNEKYFEEHVLNRIKYFLANSFTPELQHIIENLPAKHIQPIDPELLRKFKLRMKTYIKDKYVSPGDAALITALNDLSRPTGKDVGEFIAQTEKK